MFKTIGDDIKGKTAAISGSGNVAQYAAEKCLQLGVKVVTLSDSDGVIYDPDGLDESKLHYILHLKNVDRGRIREYAEKFNVEYIVKGKPWIYDVDIALPCATQNELTKDDAMKLVDNNVQAVAEGANMPSTPEAIEEFQEAKVLFAPGKAANAGGVATSGLEMAQNSQRYFWDRDEVDLRLHQIMVNIHRNAFETAKYFGEPSNYVLGANIAGFIKIANSMIAQGFFG
jgi:glutamate dehydrogenase (NADP+)